MLQENKDAVIEGIRNYLTKTQCQPHRCKFFCWNEGMRVGYKQVIQTKTHCLLFSSECKNPVSCSDIFEIEVTEPQHQSIMEATIL